MKEYKAFGTLVLNVSKSVDGDNEKGAAEKLVSKFNTYAIKSITIQVELENGEIHNLEINDLEEFDWSSLEEVGEREKKPSSKRLND